MNSTRYSGLGVEHRTLRSTVTVTWNGVSSNFRDSVLLVIFPCHLALLSSVPFGILMNGNQTDISDRLSVEIEMLRAFLILLLVGTSSHLHFRFRSFPPARISFRKIDLSIDCPIFSLCLRGGEPANEHQQGRKRKNSCDRNPSAEDLFFDETSYQKGKEQNLLVRKLLQNPLLVVCYSRGSLWLSRFEPSRSCTLIYFLDFGDICLSYRIHSTCNNA